MKRRDFLAAAAIPVLPAPAKPWVGVDMGLADSSVIWSVSPDESLFANIAVSGFSNIDQKDDEWGIGVPALESGRQLAYTEDVLRALDGIVWAVK